MRGGGGGNDENWTVYKIIKRPRDSRERGWSSAGRVVGRQNLQGPSKTAFRGVQQVPMDAFLFGVYK